ncbi:MAG TPA: hypothetical protein VF784_17125 [Anaerolineales bacterium]
MNTLLVLSHVQAVQLLKARGAGRAATITSTDLNMTSAPAAIDSPGVTFANGRSLAWTAIETIASAPNACFVVRDQTIQKIQAFSPLTNRFCSLLPTRLAPTLLIAGFPMHRIKDTDPYRDTQAKVTALGPVVGRVLDTCMGLGYTAIEASKTAEQVITIELDPAVVEIARLNPWSQELFDNPNITCIFGDCREVVEDFAPGTFSRILHDPPNFSLAGELYSGAFYRELFRVLSRSGRLFHYIGDLQGNTNRRIVPGVVRRLKEAGFRQVRPRPQAFGLVAEK